jgi:hypothetical protein
VIAGERKAGAFAGLRRHSASSRERNHSLQSRFFWRGTTPAPLEKKLMRYLVIALAAATALSSGAFAQSATPTATAKYANVPDNAVLGYNLIGLHVQDRADFTVGEIKDVVLEKGHLVGYILWVGGPIGLGERYVVLDPASVGLTWDDAGKKWKAIINATKDELKAAPEFKYEGKFKH